MIIKPYLNIYINQILKYKAKPGGHRNLPSEFLKSVFHSRSSPRASRLERAHRACAFLLLCQTGASVVPPFFGQPSRGSSPGNGR